jgi:hypothetical protein
MFPISQSASLSISMSRPRTYTRNARATDGERLEETALNERLEARGLGARRTNNRTLYGKSFTKAVGHAVESILPQLAGRDVLMHEDNQTICHILTCLSSRSHVMMEEL